MDTQARQALLADTQNRYMTLSSGYASARIISANDAVAFASTQQVVVMLGSRETLNASASVLVAALGTADRVVSTAAAVGFIPMGSGATLVQQTDGAVIGVDLSQALAAGRTGEIDANRSTIIVGRFCQVLTSTVCGVSVPSYSAKLLVQGDENLIRTGATGTDLTVVGHLNVITGGAQSTTVTLSGFDAAGNVVIGSCGSMSVCSTAVATKVIGGSGALTVSITADAASIIGGSGRLNAVIRGNGGDFQTGNGLSTISFTGFGGVFATGAGCSTICYNGLGGLLYQASAAGTAIFNAIGDGLAIYGGDRVRTVGDGNEVHTRGQIVDAYDADSLRTLFTSGIEGFLPNTVIETGLRTSGAAFLPDVAGGGFWNASSGPAPSAARTVDFNGNQGAVYTGDRFTLVDVAGNDNAIYAGRVTQYVRISSGSGNGMYAGQGGGNNYYDGGSGRNYLDYVNAAAPVTVNLETGLARNAFGGTDTLRNFNWVDAGGGATLIAGAANATLTVYGDEGLLIGGAGNDRLHSIGTGARYVTGTGNDYVLNEGADASYLIRPAAYGNTEIDQAVVGVTGRLIFEVPDAVSRLWFSHDSQGGLVASLLGTTASATVDRWYVTDGSATQLSRIGTSGSWLDTDGVNAVERAMASYSAAHPGFNPASNSMQPFDAGIAAAFAQYARAA